MTREEDACQPWARRLIPLAWLVQCCCQLRGSCRKPGNWKCPRMKHYRKNCFKGRKKWKVELVHLNWIKAPRCYFEGRCPTNTSFQLHHFSDAFEFGYGTVSYLRKEADDGTVQCSFIMAKSHTLRFGMFLCLDWNYRLPPQQYMFMASSWERLV